MKRTMWTQEERDTLIRLYPTHFAGEIAAILGKSKPSVYGQVLRLGLHAPKEKIRRAALISVNHPNSVAARFQKGHVPDNKGKKVSPETYAKLHPTMFKKGHRPINHREVGSERINVDGYIEVKVAEPNRWKVKHRVIWEQHNGAIPRGFNVQFKNHNPLDCRIENLYLISKAEQMRTENSFLARYPKELQDVIRLKGAINRQIRKREKNGE